MYKDYLEVNLSLSCSLQFDMLNVAFKTSFFENVKEDYSYDFSLNIFQWLFTIQRQWWVRVGVRGARASHFIVQVGAEPPLFDPLCGFCGSRV